MAQNDANNEPHEVELEFRLEDYLENVEFTQEILRNLLKPFGFAFVLSGAFNYCLNDPYSYAMFSACAITSITIFMLAIIGFQFELNFITLITWERVIWMIFLMSDIYELICQSKQYFLDPAHPSGGDTSPVHLYPCLFGLRFKRASTILIQMLMIAYTQLILVLGTQVLPRNGFSRNDAVEKLLLLVIRIFIDTFRIVLHTGSMQNLLLGTEKFQKQQ